MTEDISSWEQPLFDRPVTAVVDDWFSTPEEELRMKNKCAGGGLFSFINDHGIADPMVTGIEDPMVTGIPKPAVKDPQIGGDHYASLDPEPIDVIRSWFPREQMIGFMRGNVLKYVARLGNKPGGSVLQDARKARQYLDWLIEALGDGSDV